MPPAFDPNPEVWKPITGMPPDAHGWAYLGYAPLAERWLDMLWRIKKDPEQDKFVAGWLAERQREFSIETGQIEGLYTLKRGITQQLIAEGLAGVTASHTVENVEDRTIQGLLADQNAAFDMMFHTAFNGRSLTTHDIRGWHQLLTRHQETVVGLTMDGKHVQVPFKNKGVWKVRPNNPRRPDGVMHEYCPPEHVQSEMDRLIDLYAEIREQGYPPEVEAGWLHHRFVRTHPFQDGNGRVSRLLMAYVYVRQNLPPPVVLTEARDDYIDALEDANTGNLKAFTDHVGYLALGTLTSAARMAERALRGELSRAHACGGRTVNNQYLPPVREEQGDFGR